MTDLHNVFGHDPIERFQDDRLNRSTFSRLLVKALAGSPERRSMVVALYGDWGSGKTSTLNLCFEALEELQQEDRPLVVRFNPWWYSNTGELLAQFFEELGSRLEEQAEHDDVGTLKNIKKRLTTYRRLIAPAGAAADLFVSGGALTILANLGQAAAEQAAQRKEETQNVREVRADIEEALEASERPVVVAIDDVDRLSASEIRDVFKVVKATADFPNTRYLLAFDFNTVTSALSEVQHTDGVAYLEKIVQVPFRLPDPAPGQLMELMQEGSFVAIGWPELGDLSAYINGQKPSGPIKQLMGEKYHPNSPQTAGKATGLICARHWHPSSPLTTLIEFSYLPSKSGYGC